jgi:nitrogen fixation protein NifQ
MTNIDRAGNGFRRKAERRARGEKPARADVLEIEMQQQVRSEKLAVGARLPSARDALEKHLISHSLGYANDADLAQMLAGWTLGQGSLPADLGLGRELFSRLIERHFPRLRWQPPGEVDTAQSERAARALEQDDLIQLLTAFADREVEGSFAMARIVAAGCLGGDHLWQDLGLSARRHLTALMQRNFPRLAAENSKNMRWKKFLYRRLCEMDGLVACRAPTCEACTEYSECFTSADPALGPGVPQA